MQRKTSCNLPNCFSIQLKYLVKEGTENQSSEDQVCSYKFPIVPHQWDVLDTVEEVGPNSLSDKFSNDTSTMDINDKYSDDPNSDEEAESHMPKVSTTFLSSIA
ncbi:hypothetical protein Fot_55442 [Forsythia ovata]|uniref:Uncharacterized protein n=1 Tax=Forsythia ovata TaxID=205694 RepID=A0ABD1P5F8_9LAMI